MPFFLRSNLPVDFEGSTIFNLREKAYQKDLSFQKACDAKAVKLIYEHQERNHLQLVQVLESVPKDYHSLPFSSWIKHNIPVHALTKKAHEILWHQCLMHMSPQTIQNAHKFVDGVPNLSKFFFDNIDQFPTCIDTNLCKNAPGKRSLSESVLCPYQGLFIDVAYPDQVSYDKEGKVIKSICGDIEGLSGESA